MPRRARNGEQPRRKNITSCVSADLHESISAEAKQLGKTLSTYSAELLANRKIVVEHRETMDPDLFIELKRLANNFNQTVNALNLANQLKRAPHVPDVVVKAKALVDHLIKDDLIRRRLATEPVPNDNNKDQDQSSLTN